MHMYCISKQKHQYWFYHIHIILTCSWFCSTTLYSIYLSPLFDEHKKVLIYALFSTLNVVSFLTDIDTSCTSIHNEKETFFLFSIQSHFQTKTFYWDIFLTVHIFIITWPNKKLCIYFSYKCNWNLEDIKRLPAVFWCFSFNFHGGQIVENWLLKLKTKT